MTNTAPLVDSFRISALTRGSRRVLRLAVCELEGSTTLSVPVNIVVGAAPGPTVAAVANIHGDEVEAVLTLVELWHELDPERLAGTLILVPVANPPAFACRQRVGPLDCVDLNRTFPGRADGTPSQRLAHCLMTEVVQKADFLFSMHSWHAAGRVLPYVEFGHLFPGTAEPSFKAAVACGFELIRVSHWSQGLMIREANERGIPGLEVELGGLGISRRLLRVRYKQHLQRLLQHLGMDSREEEGEFPNSKVPRVVRHFDVSAPRAGILRLGVRLGDAVDVGDTLANLYDLSMQLTDVICAPASGLVGAVHEGVSVETGTPIFRLFQDIESSDDIAKWLELSLRSRR